MSRTLSIFVFGLTAAFFAAFFFYPITQTLRGAFLDGKNNLTFTYVAEVFRNPIYTEGLWNAFLLAIFSTAAALALSLPLAWLGDRFEFPGKKLLSAHAARADDPAAVRRRDRRQEDPRAGGRLNALLRDLHLLAAATAHRLARAAPLLGRRRAQRAAPLPDPLPEPRRGAGEYRSRHGGSRRKPRLHRLAQVRQDHAAADRAGHVRGRRRSCSSGRSRSWACR